MIKYIVWVNEGLVSHADFFKSYGEKVLLIGNGIRRLKKEDFKLSDEVKARITSETQFIYTSHGGLDEASNSCTYLMATDEKIGQHTTIQDILPGGFDIIIPHGHTLIGKIPYNGELVDLADVQSDGYDGPCTRVREEVYREEAVSDSEIYNIIATSVNEVSKASSPTIHISACYAGKSFVKDESQIEKKITSIIPNAKIVVYAGDRSVLVKKDAAIFEQLLEGKELSVKTTFAEYIEKMAINCPDTFCILIEGKKIIFDRPNNVLKWDYKQSYTKLHQDLKNAIGCEYDPILLPSKEVILNNALEYSCASNLDSTIAILSENLVLNHTSNGMMKFMTNLSYTISNNMYDGGYQEAAALMVKNLENLLDHKKINLEENYESFYSMARNFLFVLYDFSLYDKMDIIKKQLDLTFKVNEDANIEIPVKIHNIIDILKSCIFRPKSLEFEYQFLNERYLTNNQNIVSKIIDSAIKILSNYEKILLSAEVKKLYDALHLEGLDRSSTLPQIDKLKSLDSNLELEYGEKDAINCYNVNQGLVIPKIKITGELNESYELGE